MLDLGLVFQLFFFIDFLFLNFLHGLRMIA
uniref:Uncharacterized protein n=1 Tax=Arundo donax TaxID=35708 RepID=A0A0A9C9C2_ARUDO